MALRGRPATPTPHCISLLKSSKNLGFLDILLCAWRSRGLSATPPKPSKTDLKRLTPEELYCVCTYTEEE